MQQYSSSVLTEIYEELHLSTLTGPFAKTSSKDEERNDNGECIGDSDTQPFVTVTPNRWWQCHSTTSRNSYSNMDGIDIEVRPRRNFQPHREKFMCFRKTDN